jgi:hypothetical protein
MTTNHLKTEVEPTAETLFKSNISRTMSNAQHNIRIMNQPCHKLLDHRWY